MIDLLDQELHRLLKSQIFHAQPPQDGSRRLLKSAEKIGAQRLLTLRQTRREPDFCPAIENNEKLRDCVESLWWFKVGVRI